MSTLTPLRLTHNEREALVALLQVHQHVGLTLLRNVPLASLLDKFLVLKHDPNSGVGNLDLSTETVYVPFDLSFPDSQRVATIKLIREIFGIGLKEAKDLSDSAGFALNHRRVLRINIQDYDIARAEAAVAAINRVEHWTHQEGALPNITLTRI